MNKERIGLSENEIAEFCQKNHIKRLSLFGSILRDDFNQDSDIDILIELDRRFKTGLIKMSKMELELSEMMGRKVDLRTPDELSDYFREKVLSEAKVIYERQ